MSSFIVTVVDRHNRTLAQFEAIGSASRAKRAGYERAAALPLAADVRVERA